MESRLVGKNAHHQPENSTVAISSSYTMLHECLEFKKACSTHPFSSLLDLYIRGYNERSRSATFSSQLGRLKNEEIETS